MGDHVMFPEKYLYGHVPSEAGAEQKLVIGKIKGTLDGKRLGIIPGTPRKYENIEYWRIQPKCYADGSTLATEVYEHVYAEPVPKHEKLILCGPTGGPPQFD